MKLIVYHSYVNKIGGVETLSYNFCKQLSKHYDILFLYESCDLDQLLRISQYVDCEKYDKHKTYECDVCILNSSWGNYPETVLAKEYIQMIHANYKEMLEKHNWRYKKWHKTTKHLAVSESVCKIFNEMYNENATVMYNLLDEIKETKPILKLVSATRLSAEKGYKRMIILANKLKQAGVKFRWIIFTDKTQYNIKDMDMEEVIYMKPTYDIFDYIKEADYRCSIK